MFGSQQARSSENRRSNQEIALGLLTLLSSEEGKEVFKRVLRIGTKDFIKAIEEYIKSLEKKAFFSSMNIDKSKLVKVLDDFKKKIENIDDKDHKEVLDLIKNRYTINDTLMTEGFIIGIVEWIKKFVEEYYALIETDNDFEMENIIKRKILKRVSDEILLSKESINKIFPSKSGFKSLTNKDDIDERVKVLEENKTTFLKVIDYKNNNQLEKIAELSGNEKEYSKLQKIIDSEIKNSERLKKDKFEEFDKKLFEISQNIILELLKLRKDVFPRSLLRELISS